MQPEDGRTIPNGTVLETDICIVGTGAAGITLAREFTESSYRICLLESGGMQKDGKTQSLYEGQNIGLPHIPLTWPRDRYFGGTTNSWTGQCRPLDSSDFEQRRWLPHSGWPFPKSHLDPFYERAHAVCQLGPYSYELKDWMRGDVRELPLDGSALVTNLFQMSPPTRFGMVYKHQLVASKNTDIFLYSNVVEIETNEGGSETTALRVVTLEGNSFHVKARFFVLATGGIENARLLLLSDRVNRNGLGNQNDLVGRFFTQHLLFASGLVRSDRSEMPAALYQGIPEVHPTHRVPFKVALSLSETQRRRDEVAGAALELWPVPTDSEPTGAPGQVQLTDLDDAVHQLAPPDKGSIFRLWNMTEQTPNPDSRISLARKRDRLGLRQVQLDWRLNSLDKHSIWQTHKRIGQAFGGAGLGRVKIELDRDHTIWEPVPKGGHHHMGTTRMHTDPKRGVVDAACKVHDVANLYVAGSSVFPTGGFANPTLTIVAMAIRLAKHIKRELKR